MCMCVLFHSLVGTVCDWRERESVCVCVWQWFTDANIARSLLVFSDDESGLRFLDLLNASVAFDVGNVVRGARLHITPPAG